jgi:2-keto-4-pentenoate hydratase/2-oxohepta-3-ene-1,7-dioic acid hydratase in catechol pathway
MNTVIFNSHHVTPSKVVCIGWNYVAHIEELNNEMPTEPVLFIKPNSSISSAIMLPADEPVDYEAEIAFIVRDGQLAGVGFGLDLTKRGLQNRAKAKGQPWERAKSFDNSAVFSHFVPLDVDFHTLEVQLTINEKVVQSGGVNLMIYKPDFLLEEISSSFSLEDFDIIMTGTPAGTGIAHSGDIFIGRIHAGEDCLIEQQWLVQ